MMDCNRIKEVLVTLVNLTAAHGSVPLVWKQAEVTLMRIDGRRISHMRMSTAKVDKWIGSDTMTGSMMNGIEMTGSPSML
jgi:hypothetical protein